VGVTPVLIATLVRTLNSALIRVAPSQQLRIQLIDQRMRPGSSRTTVHQFQFKEKHPIATSLRRPTCAPTRSKSSNLNVSWLAEPSQHGQPGPMASLRENVHGNTRCLSVTHEVV
jgi:hypothetical protein